MDELSESNVTEGPHCRLTITRTISDFGGERRVVRKVRFLLESKHITVMVRLKRGLMLCLIWLTGVLLSYVNWGPPWVIPTITVIICTLLSLLDWFRPIQMESFELVPKHSLCLFQPNSTDVIHKVIDLSEIGECVINEGYTQDCMVAYYLAVLPSKIDLSQPKDALIVPVSHLRPRIKLIREMYLEMNRFLRQG